MSPRGSRVRTAKDEKALDSAIKKAEKQGWGEEAEKSVGSRLREGWKENA